MKRLNVKLVAWLAASSIVLVVGVHFLHAYQINRNASVLLAQAENEQQAEHRAEAAKLYSQYLKYRIDDEKVSEKLAYLMVEIAEQPNHTRRDRNAAWQTLEATVRQHPELTKLRRRLVDFLIEGQDPIGAEKHILELQGTDQADAALDVKHAQCIRAMGHATDANNLLAKLVGFNLQTMNFDAPSKATAAGEIDAYTQLSHALFSKPFLNRQAAVLVINTMVERNSKSEKAYLARAFYFQQVWQAAANGPKNAENEKLAKESRESAAADANKALELAPDDPDAIIQASYYKQIGGEVAEARELLDHGIEKNPKSEMLYYHLSLLDSATDVGKALDVLRDGLKILPMSPILLRTYADMQLQKGDLSGLRETIAKMDQEGYMGNWVTYFKAEALYAEKHWLQAARQLERLRIAMARSPNFVGYLNRIDVNLAVCYENLGEPDRALQAATRVHEARPDLPQPLMQMARAHMALNHVKEARQLVVEANKLRKDDTGEHAETNQASNTLNAMVSAELKKPETQRDWTEVNKLLDQLLADKSLTDLQKIVLTVQVMVLKEDWDSARKTLLKALNSKNPDTQENRKDRSLWLMTLSVYDNQPAAGADGKTPPDKAAAAKAADEKVKELFKIVKAAKSAAGDSLQLRVAEADLITRYKEHLPGATDAKTGTELAVAKLKQLEEGIDDDKRFPPEEQAWFWSNLGRDYYQLHDYDGARGAWLQVTVKRPDDLSTREKLFTLALDSGKDKDAESALNEIRRASGSDSALYLYCLGMRSFSKVQREYHGKRGMEKAEASELELARTSLNQAKNLRPNWFEVYRVLGSIDDLQGLYDSAITNYRKSLEFGPPNSMLARRVVELLFAQGRNEDAEHDIEAMGPIAASDPLQKVIIRSRLNQESDEAHEDALAKAKRAVEQDPESADAYLVLAQVYERLHEPKLAEENFALAVEKSPKAPETWLMLLTHLKKEHKIPRAKRVVDEAKEKLPADVAPAVLAYGYEIIGDLKAAERHYLEAEKQHPEQLTNLRRVASFYMRAKADSDALAAAAKGKAKEDFKKDAAAYNAEGMAYLDRILKMKPTQEELPTVLWARRAKAQIVAKKGGFANLQAALKLIEENAVGGTLSNDDMAIEAELLSGRQDFESRKKAIKIYETLGTQKGHALTMKEQIHLADLYDKVGRWTDARTKMIDLVNRSKTQRERNMVSVIEMFLQHNELGDAESMLKQLEKWDQESLARVNQLTGDEKKEGLVQITPILVSTKELQARLLVKQGHPELAEKIANSFMTDTSAEGLKRSARSFEAMGLLKPAQDRLERAAEADQRNRLALATFLGLHDGNLDEVLQLYEDSKIDWPLATITESAIQTLDARRTTATKEQFAKVMEMIDKGLADNDESAQELQVQKCELLELQAHYAEVIPIYRKILADPKFDVNQKARVQNNLAYLLAINDIAAGKSGNASEALTLVNATIDLMGPTSEVLDTRAMVYLASEQYKEAVADARMSVLENPTSLKYFHLALAEMRSGNRGKAREALKMATDMKLETQISQIEKPVYEQLNTELYPPKA